MNIFEKIKYNFESLYMKVKLLIAIGLFFASCTPDHHGLDFKFYNDSLMDLSFIFPCKIYGYCMGGLIFESRDLKEVSPKDTTIIGYNDVSVSCSTIAGEVCNCYSSYGLFEIFKLDTLRVFVCKKHEYDLAQVESYLLRYDITKKDYFKLVNGNGELEIHFPPDERMKDIKMWPKYEDVISEYGNISIDNENINSNVQ